jgi:membrane-bound serine protease (ClpP class)
MDEVSLVLPVSLLVAGLVLIAVEFFLPTVFIGFLGAAISFVGIYLSAEAGAFTCALFCVAFVFVLALEFFAFRRLLPQTGIGRAMINVSSNDGAAVPAAAGFAVYVGKTGKAVTVLAPSGTAEVDGALLEAFSLDGFVERGAPVVVVEAGAGRVSVRRAR